MPIIIILEKIKKSHLKQNKKKEKIREGKETPRGGAKEKQTKIIHI